MKRGGWGEQAAADYLTARGYTIVARNYRTRWGEIDLIVQDDRYLVFVEVKTRKSSTFAAAREAVGAAKQHRMLETAQIWLSEHPTARQPRLDVIEVYGPEGGPARYIEHIPNAFEA